MERTDRRRIFNETVDIVNAMDYESPKGEIVELNLSDTVEKDTEFISSRVKVDYDKVHRLPMQILVVNQDCLEIANSLVREGYKTAVLNMASFSMPCGGVLGGSAAQEENISRRTDLFRSLYMFHEIGKDFGIPQRKERYPLDFRYGAIYTPNVTVFRHGEDKEYELMEKPFRIDVITASAIKGPRLTADGHIHENDAKVIKTKIAQILDLGLIYRDDALVLGAFGCGAYRTPPREMARLFKEVLSEERYHDAFAKVVFAILDDHNTRKEHNPEGNFKPFMETFYDEA